MLFADLLGMKPVFMIESVMGMDVTMATPRHRQHSRMVVRA